MADNGQTQHLYTDNVNRIVFTRQPDDRWRVCHRGFPENQENTGFFVSNSELTTLTEHLIKHQHQSFADTPSLSIGRATFHFYPHSWMPERISLQTDMWETEGLTPANNNMFFDDRAQLIGVLQQVVYPPKVFLAAPGSVHDLPYHLLRPNRNTP